MNNKVLIKLFIPECDKEYDVFIPTNEILWKVKDLLIKIACELSGLRFTTQKQFIMLNKKTNEIYSNNIIVRDTDIRNGTEIILMEID